MHIYGNTKLAMAGLGDWATFVFLGKFFKNFQASSAGYL